MVRHLARVLQESEDEWLGPAEPPHADTFIDLVNELATHYAEFGAEPQRAVEAGDFAPDFGFLRYLGHRLEATVPASERRWVQDQVVSSEAPDAVDMLRKALRDLFAPPARRPRRQAVSGD